MTSEHLRPLLQSEKDMTLFWQIAQDLARAAVPDVIVDSVRLGRITALQKPNGGVRGIIAGDMFRRLVARTMSQQLSKAVEGATSPFQWRPHHSVRWRVYCARTRVYCARTPGHHRPR